MVDDALVFLRRRGTEEVPAFLELIGAGLLVKEPHEQQEVRFLYMQLRVLKRLGGERTVPESLLDPPDSVMQ
jgi:hypothetical protein